MTMAGTARPTCDVRVVRGKYMSIPELHRLILGMDFAHPGCYTTVDGKELWNLTVLGGVVAAPCYSQSAIARRNSFPRVVLDASLLS